MKPNETTIFLEKELGPRPADMELVDARLRRVYSQLPEALPVRRRMPFWLARSLCTAASLLLAMGLLLGVNQVNPAWAEGLPFVGSIFQSINDRGMRPNKNIEFAKTILAERSVEVPPGEEGHTAAIPAANPLTGPRSATLKEVYYDGTFVFAGIEFQLGEDCEGVLERWGPGFDFILNGESQVLRDQDGYPSYPGVGNGFVDISNYYFTNLGGGAYVMQKGFRVPDHMQGADTLDVVLGFDGFLTVADGGKPFTLSFTAQKTDVPTRTIGGGGLEQNGVRLVSATASPAVTCIVTEYPESYVNPACWACFSDGISIGGLGGCSDTRQDGMVRNIEVYAGLRESESRELVWTLFDKNGSSQHEAVFVLDFQTGTARAGSAEDIKEAPLGDYACGAEAIKSLTEGYLVEKLHMSQEKPMLYIATAGGYEELQVELLQDGTVLDSATAGEPNWYEDYAYWEYGSPEADDRDLADPDTRHKGWMIMMLDSYVNLDMAKPVTVRAYNAAGDLVLEEEITLAVTTGSW